MTDTATAVSAVTLGAYPAKWCARRIHNLFDPAAPAEPAPPADVQARLDEGLLFEAGVNLAFALGVPAGMVQVLGDDDGWDANVAATMAAMADRVPVIVNGRLPNIGQRTGAPDVLILAGDGYVPVDVKNHRTLSKAFEDAPVTTRTRSKVVTSTLTDPTSRRETPGPSNKGAHWRDDTMQLAHYTRMLQALGLHAGDGYLWGGIIGTSDLTAAHGEPVGIVWYDLAAPGETTFSASAEKGRADRSPMERYDHEFGFRLTVAQTARDGGALVRPYRTVECDGCPWATYCADTAGADDASFAVETGCLTVREWQTLYTAGAATVTGLAALDPASVAEEFVAASVGTRQPEARLTAAIRRARMAVSGVELEPHTGDVWPAPPTADIEVDFDIEWDVEGRIYQWGARVRDGQHDTTARYLPVVSFAVLDDDAEAVLADEFAAWLTALIADAEEAGRSVTIFHWHHVEVSRTRRFPRVAALLEGRTVDLMVWLGEHLFTRRGVGLKPVASALGFTGWDQVADAGGSESQRQIELARTGDVTAQAWCLAYNGADVAAQACVRDALAALAG